MVVRFVAGRAGSGKTRFCVDGIIARLSDPASAGRLIFIVPEQASLQMERALALRAPAGGYTRAAVLSFSRLAHLALDAAATPLELAPGARRLALRRIAIASAAELRTLRGAVALDGFFVELDGIVETLLRENISPDTLRTAAAQLDDPARLDDLTLLYERYREWLGDSRFDPAARLALVRAHLDRLDWLHDATIWVDGFAGFTGQELDTLTALAQAAREMFVTLLLDPAAPALHDRACVADPMGLFHRTERTCQQLRRRFDQAGVAVEPPIRLAPPQLPRFSGAATLAALEGSLAAAFGDTGESPQPIALQPNTLRVVACKTARDELRAAAHWIRARIAESAGRLRYRDFALIARDIKPYAPLVEEVFEAFELPYFLDQRRPLGAHPLMRFVAALIAAAKDDLDVASAVQLLRTRLLPLTRDASESLESLLLRSEAGGVDTWREASWVLEDGFAVTPDSHAARSAIADGVARLRGALDAETCTGRVFVTSFWDAIQSLGVAPALAAWIEEAERADCHEAAELHRLAWDALVKQLDEIVDVLGDQALPGGDWTSILTAGLADVSLGLAPPLVDQVLVSAIERSRHPDVRHAWVLGFNDGVFPARPQEDRLLSTEDREKLATAGLEALEPARADAFGERLLAYISLTRASHELVISYAGSNAAGDALLPSPLLADVYAAAPALRAEPPPEGEPPTTLAALARLHLLAHADARKTDLARRSTALIGACRTDPARAAVLDWLLRGLHYNNAPAAIPAKPVWRGGVSQVEAYLACPFKHFARYRLRLDPERQPQPLRWELGDIAHDVLARTTRVAMSMEGGVRGRSADEWGALVDREIVAIRAGWPPQVTQRRPEASVLLEALARRLRALAAAHGLRWRRGRFEPHLIEAPMNDAAVEGTLPRVAFDLDDGRRIELEGRADRIDIARSGSEVLALVYDYKSSAGVSFRAAYLTGLRLQLFTYLLAAGKLRVDGIPVVPAGVLVAPLFPKPTVTENTYYIEADTDARLMHLFRPDGLIAEPAAELLDSLLGTLKVTSPVADMRRKNDGGYWANCDVKPLGLLKGIRDAAEKTIRLAGDGLTTGSIDVSPLVEDGKRVCRFCEFQAVCRFDPAYNQSRVAEKALPQIAQFAATDGGGE